MPKTLLVGLVVALLASGCATQQQSTSAPESLPDGRDLAEHPLDVLAIPQP